MWIFSLVAYNLNYLRRNKANSIYTTQNRPLIYVVPEKKESITEIEKEKKIKIAGTKNENKRVVHE